LAFDFLHSIGLGELSDEELLDRYKRSSDQKWMSQLFGRYVRLIYGVCLRYSPDVREAEDHTMEIYEKAVNKALTHNVKSFKSWIYVLSKNHCLEKIRKMTGKRMVNLPSSFMQLSTEMHLMDETSDLQERETKLTYVEECMERLGDLQRTSIDLFYYKNKTYAEIAGLIEDEVSQVRSYLQNGRRNMKKCLERKMKHGRS